MQNVVNQNITIRIGFLQTASGYLSGFGNYPGNGLVTQILQYFAGI